jgi:archaellum biogenesis protein FlaJ (TadC family)
MVDRASMEGPIVIPDKDTRDRIFEVNLERSRVYWDYYRSMFIVFSLCLIGGMVCTALVYSSGGIGLPPAVGIMLLLVLLIILLAAMMSLTIWRHENKHLDELIAMESEDVGPPSTGGEPLV